MLSALSLASSDAFARTEARYLLRTDGAYFGNDIFSSTSIQNLFHQQTLQASDVEHYDMSFPVFADDLALGPVTGGITADGITETDGASSNVLPFGPVNLAFPSIHEDTTQSLSASRTGFMSSNYNYRSETDYGNIPVSPTYPETVQQVIDPAPMFGWSQLYPEQYGTIAMRKKLKEANQPTAALSNQTKPANRTSANATAASATNDTIGTWLNREVKNSTDTIYAPGDKLSFSMDFFKAKNASSRPQDMPVIYPWYFDMADKTVQTFPSNGIGGTWTNGGGSTGVTFGRKQKAAEVTTANQTGNKTGNNTTGTGTKVNRAIGTSFTTTDPPETSDLTYADFNFDATSEEISRMSVVERMWRNSHRGGTMGKAYAGYTDRPLWIDPYDRPYDVSMIDEHWYVLQCALNMTQPGTQILPRQWTVLW